MLDQPSLWSDMIWRKINCLLESKFKFASAIITCNMCKFDLRYMCNGLSVVHDKSQSDSVVDVEGPGSEVVATGSNRLSHSSSVITSGTVVWFAGASYPCPGEVLHANSQTSRASYKPHTTTQPRLSWPQPWECAHAWTASSTLRRWLASSISLKHKH